MLELDDTGADSPASSSPTAAELDGLTDEEYRLASLLLESDEARLVYADWLEEQGLAFAAIAQRLAADGFEWRHSTGRLFSFLAPRYHPSLVNRVLGICTASNNLDVTERVNWWSLAPSSVTPEEHWDLEPEHFAELIKQIQAKERIEAEYRGKLPARAAILNILGIAQFWNSINPPNDSETK